MEDDPLYRGSTERIFSKIRLALESGNSMHRGEHDKLDAIQRRQAEDEKRTSDKLRAIEVKQDSLVGLVRSIDKALALNSKELGEARRAIDEVREHTGRTEVPTREELERESISKRGIFLGWATIGNVLKHWKHAIGPTLGAGLTYLWHLFHR